MSNGAFSRRKLVNRLSSSGEEFRKTLPLLTDFARNDSRSSVKSSGVIVDSDSRGSRHVSHIPLKHTVFVVVLFVPNLI